MKKKVIAICLVAALLLVAAVGATWAYFNDKASVKNTFVVGNVDITLDEAEVEFDDADHTWNPTQTRTEIGNSYGEEYPIYPGAVLPKDPTIHNVGNTDAYVGAKIEIDFDAYQKLAALYGVDLTNGTNDEEFLQKVFGMDTTNWTAVRSINFPPTKTVIQCTYSEKVAAGEDVKLFDQIVIPGTAENGDLPTNFDVEIVAYAIQTDGFADASTALHNTKLYAAQD